MVSDWPITSDGENSKMRWAAPFQLRMTPSRLSEMIASSDDSTIAASCSRVSMVERSRSSFARWLSARSRSAMTAASASPDTASTPKRRSGAPAANGVLAADGRGPSPSAPSRWWRSEDRQGRAACRTRWRPTRRTGHGERQDVQPNRDEAGRRSRQRRADDQRYQGRQFHGASARACRGNAGSVRRAASRGAPVLSQANND